MKVAENSTEALRLEYVPWILSAILLIATVATAGFGINMLLAGEFPAAFIGTGVCGIALAAFAERTQFWADRQSDSFSVRSRTVFGASETVLPLSQIRAAQLQRSQSSKGGTTYRPALILTDGTDLPLRKTYSSGNDAASTVRLINAWLGVAPEERAAFV